MEALNFVAFDFGTATSICEIGSRSSEIRRLIF